MDFPPHKRPNASRLEAFTEEIAAMRSKSWPYQRVVDWLKREKGHTVSIEGLRLFCSTRKIIKGQAGVTGHQPTRRPFSEPVKTEGLFSFDETKPIETRKNR